MKKVVVNSGRQDSEFKIDVIEAKYNAKYVGQFCPKNKSGGWVNDPIDVFYQKNPPNGYSPYLGIFQNNEGAYITSGQNAVSGNIIGVIADDGEIIYSRFRHDYRISTDGSTFIDGGRDYTRSNRRTIILKVIDGEFYEMEE